METGGGFGNGGEVMGGDGLGLGPVRRGAGVAIGLGERGGNDAAGAGVGERRGAAAAAAGRGHGGVHHCGCHPCYRWVHERPGDRWRESETARAERKQLKPTAGGGWVRVAD